METVLASYVREGQKRVGCVVAVKNVETNKVTLGWSKCITRPTAKQKEAGITPDTFVREDALNMAKGRAAMPLEMGEQLTQSTAPNVPFKCRKALRKMAIRAQRYFFNEKPNKGTPLRKRLKEERLAKINAAFVGKTIASVDTSCVNQWTFNFTDGTSQAVEVDTIACNPMIRCFGLSLV